MRSGQRFRPGGGEDRRKSKGISQKRQENLSKSQNYWLNRESSFNSNVVPTKVVTHGVNLVTLESSHVKVDGGLS